MWFVFALVSQSVCTPRSSSACPSLFFKFSIHSSSKVHESKVWYTVHNTARFLLTLCCARQHQSHLATRQSTFPFRCQQPRSGRALNLGIANAIVERTSSSDDSTSDDGRVLLLVNVRN